MSTGLSAWLLAAGERGAEIWQGADERIHYRLPADLAADGLGAALGAKAAELRQFYAAMPQAIGPFRLAPAQAAMYFHSRIAPQSIGHVLRYAMRVRADIDAAALARALQSLAARHPMLSARVRTDRGQPLLFFSAAPTLQANTDDIDVDDADAVRQWVEQHSTTPMDLERGPLCHFHLARSARDGHAVILLLVAHHCVVDFASLEIVWRDLDRLYHAHRSRQPADLPAPTFGLCDLASLPHWQAARTAAKRQEDAWRLRLRALPAAVALDGERADARSSGSGFEFVRRVGAPTREAVQRLAQGLRMTPFAILFGVHALQMLRRSRARAICLGVATAGRNGHPQPDLVGCFVNSVPVIVEGALLSLAPMEAIRRLQRPLRDAIGADLLPFVELVKLAPVERDPGRPVLFRTLFTWLDGTRRERDALAAEYGIAASPYEPVGLSRIGVTHDLVLAVHERRAGLGLSWAFDAGVHHADTILAMADEYEQMLDALLAAPDVLAAASRTAREQFEL